MEEDKILTNDNINDAIRALGIMLDEIMANALNTKYSEKYADYDFDVITAFDCMLDDINRILLLKSFHHCLQPIQTNLFHHTQIVSHS